MKAIATYDQLSSFPDATIKDWTEGRWYHAHRVTILKSDDQYTALSLNIFERIMASLYHFFNQNYFSKILNSDTVTIIDPASMTSEDKKASDIAPGSPPPNLADKTIDERFAEFERMQEEKKAKDLEEFQKMFRDIFALEIIYTDLEVPADREMNELIEASSFAEEYIQKNGKGDSIELNGDAFSGHLHLSHFDTLIAALRRLVLGKKIHGYVVDRENSVIKVALNSQSELSNQESFVDKKILTETIVIPGVAFLKDLDEPQNEEAAK